MSDKRLVPAEEAEAIIYGDNDAYRKLEDTLYDHSRWAVTSRVVAEDKATGEVFIFFYKNGATEYQDQDTFDDDTVMFLPARQVMKPVWEVDRERM